MRFSAANILTEWRKHLRYVLVPLLCGLVALGVLGVLSLRWFRHGKLAGIMRHEVEMTANAYDRVLGPTAGGLDLLCDLGSAGLLDLDDAAKLDRLLGVLMGGHLPHVRQVLIAGSNGRVHAYPPIDQSDEAPSAAPTPIDLEQEPWYRGALGTITAEEAHLTEPYMFTTLGVPGITASRRYSVAGREGVTFVVALKVGLADLGAVATEIGIGEDSRILTLSRGRVRDFDELVVGTPDPNSLDDLGADAVAAVEDDDGPLKLRSNGGVWWVGARESAVARTPTKIVLAVPERHLLAQTGIASHLLLAGYLLVLAGVGLVAILGARQSDQALESLAELPRHAGDSAEQIKALIRAGESETLEFKSTLRWNLKADRVDKNIELACLKTMVAFMNTEGGTLLVGVTDEGAVSGIEADNFQNEDKLLLHFNNLIKTHIGLEFAELISFEVKRIDRRSVLVVDSGRSSDPVFLRHGSEEEFYIRVGPGSRKLPTSKVLSYVRTR
jgi:hypothetical protein